MKKFIEDSVWEAVAMAAIPDDLKKALKRAPKTKVFLSNLHRECLKSTRFIKNKYQLKSLIYDMTRMFLDGVLAFEKQRNASLAEKAMLRTKAEDEQAKLKAFDKAVETGIVNEETLGV